MAKSNLNDAQWNVIQPRIGCRWQDLQKVGLRHLRAFDSSFGWPKADWVSAAVWGRPQKHPKRLIAEGGL